MAEHAARPVLYFIALVLVALGGLVACGEAAEEGALGVEVKAPHFIDSAPVHRQALAAPPINVVVNTDFDLMSGSSIRVLRGEDDYGEGETAIDENRLTMRRAVRGDAPDGGYLVTYRACWPDGSCHDGRFSFEIDRRRLDEYQDLRGKAEVRVTMENIKFLPAKIIVSAGTEIIWTNRDSVEHFVNTDPHPSHTYHLAQNSLGIGPDGSFSVTLAKPGEYPYHCSAHYPQGMIASVVVAAD